MIFYIPKFIFEGLKDEMEQLSMRLLYPFCEPYKNTMLISYSVYASENTFFALKIQNVNKLSPFNFFERKMSFLYLVKCFLRDMQADL